VLVAQPPGSPAPARRDPLQALAEDTGAGVVVSGSYYLQGQTLYFQAKISDAVQRKLIYALDPASGAVATPLEAIDTLRQRVMGALATKFAMLYDIRQQRPPTDATAHGAGGRAGPGFCHPSAVRGVPAPSPR
jgi:hypothetical protein